MRDDVREIVQQEAISKDDVRELLHEMLGGKV